MSDLRPVPYPADTRAKGWRFELDYERIRQSDTWALAAPEIRPWLLMLWMTAWEQTPCGSLPDDDELIAARIGMDLEQFQSAKKRLMRGWWAAEDGRLYHNTMVERVLEMLETRDKERARKAGQRERKKTADPSGDVPDLSHGTDGGQPQDSTRSHDTGTGTGTGFKTKNLSVPIGTDAGASPAGLSAKDAIYHVAVPWLVERGVPDKNARSLLGGAVKQLGEEGAWALAQECMRVAPLEPAAWIAGAINSRMKPAQSRPNKQQALEAQNRAVAERLAQEES